MTEFFQLPVEHVRLDDCLDVVHQYVNIVCMMRIEFYKTVQGTSPVEEFLDTLDDSQVNKVLWVLKLVREQNPVPASYFCKMVNTDDIWEVRVQFGGNIFRLLGFFDGSNLIILTHGFQKKSQKTPKQEIKLAESRKREYLGRR
jgi:phage-related protein